MMSGFLIIDKSSGITSHDVVNRVRKISNQKRVGHTGTLDPFATGVLLVTLGYATRLGEYTNSLTKTYTANMTLGAVSDTDDVTGKITSIHSDNVPTDYNIKNTLKRFVGTIEQVPPIYAAIKIKGKKLYEYARAGKHVERRARRVVIHDIQLLAYTFPSLTLSVTCSSGTYIRALARDIGTTLNSGAYLEALRRDAIGKFTIEEAVNTETLTPGNIEHHIRPPAGLIQHLPSINLNEENVAKFKSGGRVFLPHSQPRSETRSVSTTGVNPVAVFDSKQQLIGIGHATSPSTISPTKVFATL